MAPNRSSNLQPLGWVSRTMTSGWASTARKARNSPKNGLYPLCVTASSIANRYSLDTEYLKILNLNSPDYTILNWIAVLVAHRLFSIKSPAAQRAKRYLIDNFGVNVNAYDLIIGYRADDSYFDFAASFLNNGISVQQLANAMRLGKLGEQIVIKSKYAFSLLHYDGFSIAEKEKYYVRRKARNDEADQLYSDILEEETDGLYILDIIRGGIQNDDPRIPRNLSE